MVTSLTLGVLVGGRAAHAQSADAEALFDQGNALMQQGKLAQACEAFEASNRAEPTAGTLIQLGKCLVRSDRFASAFSAYQDALRRAKDPAKRKNAGGAITALEPRLSRLTISVPDERRVAELTIARDGKPVEPADWNHALAVDGDDNIIVAHAPGHQPWQTTVRVAVERDQVVVEILQLEALPRPVEAAPLPAVVPPASPRTTADSPAPRPRATLSATRKIAIGLGGASVLGLGTGVVLGMAAQGKHTDASRLCPGSGGTCAQSAAANVLVRAGNRWALDANIAWGVAGAAALASGVLWLIGGPADTEGPRVSVIPAVASGEVGVVVIRRSSW